MTTVTDARASGARRGPSRRALVGGAILLAWIVGLGLLVRRELFRPAAERLALAGLNVSPGASFYRVERDGRHVGYATSTVDTSERAISITDQVVTAGGRDGGRMEVRASLALSRALAPQEFMLRVVGAELPLALTGRMRGDSALELRVTADGTPAEPQIVPTQGRVYPATAVPLLVALGEQRRVGGRVAVTLFDPTSMSARATVLRVTAESLFTVSDSAAFAESAQAWVSVHQDTVRAWHVEAEGEGAALAGWVDAQGRIVEAAYPGGYRLVRTSYEEAAENWRRESAAAGRRPPVRADSVGRPATGLRPRE